MCRVCCGLWVLWVVSGIVVWDRAAHAAEDAFVIGACTHFSQGKGILDRNLERIKQAGIASIRDEVGWGAVEREKGKLAMPEQFDSYVRRAAAQGVNVLLILDYGNRFYDDGDRPRSPEAIEGFCRYAEFVVRHFGKAVRLYEIWNEWDISIGMPSKYRPRRVGRGLRQAAQGRVSADQGRRFRRHRDGRGLHQRRRQEGLA